VLDNIDAAQDAVAPLDTAAKGSGAAHNRRLEREEREQFKLVQIQSFNWGTFSGHLKVDVATKGMLFIGPSGSGKSTIFDSHASLLTPPKWLNFNVAARESESRQDRNLVTYVRGVWGEQTGSAGEIADQQLRPGPTWSAIAETYRNGDGKIVTLIHVYWIRTASNASRDVGKRYLVADRGVDLGELKFFPESRYNARRFKTDLHGVFDTDAFSEYQERFRSRLGIDSEHALKLLHKTQSAKNLGGLTDFLRDFMLDEPRTRAMADDLVEQFSKLDNAHNEVVSAGLQIAALMPAREANEQRQQLLLRRGELDEIRAGVDNFQQERRTELLHAQRQSTATALDGQTQLLQVRETQKQEARTDLERLLEQRRGMGGEQLERLEHDLQQADQEAREREAKRERVRQACVVLGATLPDKPEPHAELVGWTKAELERSANGDEAEGAKRSALAVSESDLARRLGKVQNDLASLARLPRSNIPTPLTDMRWQIAKALHLREDELPFGGELIEVHPSEKSWQGAIERVLRGFALSMLVEERLYSTVSRHVDKTHLNGRLVYIRMLPQTSPAAKPSSNSIVQKVAVADGAHRQWVSAELGHRFDLPCVDTADELKLLASGVTRSGLIKQGGRRHEKDDRKDVDDATHWVLGTDTRAKVSALQDEADSFNEQLEAVRRELKLADERSRNLVARVRAYQTISDHGWQDIDTATPAQRARALREQARQLRESSPDLAAIDARIDIAQQGVRKADEQRDTQAAQVLATAGQLKELEEEIRRRADLAFVAPTPLQRKALNERLETAGRTPTLTSLADDMRVLERRLSSEVNALDSQLSELVRKIEEAFAAYNRGWAAESNGLDPKLACYDEYDAKLTRLQIDDLPRVERKFKQLLNEQSNQHIALLSNQIEQERRDISEKMDAVNLSLRNAEFNPRTYLSIEVEDRTPTEAKEFKADLRAALANTLSVDDTEAEARFQALKALIKRLASQQTSDINWKTMALDVRLHVEFIAREMREDGSEAEAYRSGAGKSGGQRQKLTATCLAAALRYQLGGPERLRPTFSTVFLDEAFDKADAEFTEAAMKIFKMFGFQLIIATPIKSVMTIEPYVGGAVFVHIQDRMHSKVLVLPYDEDAQHIDFGALNGGGDETA
jgi:uncharacterized protein YPO0396